MQSFMAHQEAVKEAHDVAQVDVTSKTIESFGFYFGYRLIPEEQRQSIVRYARTFIVLNERDDNASDNFTAILPNYTQRDGRMASVRLWLRHEWVHRHDNRAKLAPWHAMSFYYHVSKMSYNTQ
jgi:hypothetical protein